MRFSTPIQTGPEAHLASYTVGTGSFPGVKRPGRGDDHPLSSSAEVKERVELYLHFPFTFTVCFRVNFTFNYDAVSLSNYQFVRRHLSTRDVFQNTAVINTVFPWLIYTFVVPDVRIWPVRRRACARISAFLHFFQSFNFSWKK